MASDCKTEEPLQSTPKPNPRSSSVLVHDLPDTNEIYETILWDPDEEFVFQSESTDYSDHNINVGNLDILRDDDDDIYSQTDEDDEDDEDEEEDESSSELSSSSYFTPMSPKQTQKQNIPIIPPLETPTTSQQNEDIKLITPSVESKQFKQKTQSQPPILQQSEVQNKPHLNKVQSLKYHISPKNKPSDHEKKDTEESKETPEINKKKQEINLSIITESNNGCDNEDKKEKEISVAQFKRKSKKSVKSSSKSRKSTAKKEKRIRKQSRAAKGTIAIPEIADEIINEDDGTQIIIPIKMVYLFVRARTHHKLHNYKNMNYASKSYQLDPKLVISALDKEDTVRGHCNINNGIYAFCKKNIKTQKEYKLALRTNSDDIDHANTILMFVESKLDESLQTIKKITKFNHDVCIQSIIAELNKKK